MVEVLGRGVGGEWVGEVVVGGMWEGEGKLVGWEEVIGELGGNGEGGGRDGGWGRGDGIGYVRWEGIRERFGVDEGFLVVGWGGWS